MKKKIGMTCSYLTFSIQEIHRKTAKKMVAGFCEELLSENDFETVLFSFCCYEYIIVPMLEAVQKQRL